jgi:hypothetical protein
MRALRATPYTTQLSIERLAGMPYQAAGVTHQSSRSQALGSSISKVDKSMFGFDPSGQDTHEEHPSLIPSQIGPLPPAGRSL